MNKFYYLADKSNDSLPSEGREPFLFSPLLSGAFGETRAKKEILRSLSAGPSVLTSRQSQFHRGVQPCSIFFDHIDNVLVVSKEFFNALDDATKSRLFLKHPEEITLTKGKTKSSDYFLGALKYTAVDRVLDFSQSNFSGSGHLKLSRHERMCSEGQFDIDDFIEGEPLLMESYDDFKHIVDSKPGPELVLLTSAALNLTELPPIFTCFQRTYIEEDFWKLVVSQKKKPGVSAFGGKRSVRINLSDNEE